MKPLISQPSAKRSDTFNVSADDANLDAIAKHTQ